MADDLVPAWAAPVLRRRPRQPDPTTCGPTCLVVARILHDEEYAGRASDPDTFQSEILELHRRVTSPRDTTGRMQLPWPRFFGTPPWAAARQMTAVTDTAYTSKWARTGRERAFDRIAGATDSGHLVPVFVGSRGLPRHVVLAIGRGDGQSDGQNDGALRFYEPASGRLVDVSRADFAKGQVDLAGWGSPWFTVLPA
jgi:hypothetical protein